MTRTIPTNYQFKLGHIFYFGKWRNGSDVMMYTVDRVTESSVTLTEYRRQYGREIETVGTGELEIGYAMEFLFTRHIEGSPKLIRNGKTPEPFVQ